MIDLNKDGYKYCANIGPIELTWYGHDDNYARKLVVKYIGMFWKKIGALPDSNITISRIFLKDGFIVTKESRWAVIEKITWNGTTKLKYIRGMIHAVE